MRMMLKVQMEVEAANKAIRDGTLPKIMQGVFAKIHPEASYFLAENGLRTALVFFDMKDPSEIPQIAEPFFMALNAKVDFIPVMNGDDLQKGLAAYMKDK